MKDVTKSITKIFEELVEIYNIQTINLEIETGDYLVKINVQKVHIKVKDSKSPGELVDDGTKGVL